MKKRIISLVLALMMCFSLSVTAFAEDENTSLTANELDAILNPNRETILKELREQMPHDEASLLAEGLIGASSLAKTITTTYGMRAITTTTYYYETLTMPGLQFLYVAEGWDANDYDSYSTSCTSPHYLNHTGDYLQVQTCFNDTPTGAKYVFTFERN